MSDTPITVGGTVDTFMQAQSQHAARSAIQSLVSLDWTVPTVLNAVTFSDVTHLNSVVDLNGHDYGLTIGTGLTSAVAGDIVGFVGPGTVGYKAGGSLAIADEERRVFVFDGTWFAPVGALVNPYDIVASYILPQTLTDAATITYDASNGVNAKVTLGDNRTLASITNAAAGQSGTLTIIQDGTGGRSLTLDASQTVMAGDAADIGGMAASAIGKIAWETHDGVNFYFWITT